VTAGARPSEGGTGAGGSGGARRIVIDTDPGVDDACAIAVALGSPELEVVGVTTVAGNVPLGTTTRNALRVLQLAGASSVPVAPGAERALVRLPRRHGTGGPHGPDGLWGVLDFEPATVATAGHAVELLASAAVTAPLSVVAIAPLTNLALLLAMRPDVAGRIERLYVMGGARLEGNVTPAAEFNVWSDPESAARVFASGVPITLVTLDVTEHARLTGPEVGELAGTGPVGGALAEMVRRYAASHGDAACADSGPIHDALAVLAACSPGVVSLEEAQVEVDTGTSPGRGATLIATHTRAAGFSGSRVLVGTSIDRDRFARELLARVRALDGRPGA
jgi:pyrimidine-specific ribonucleoside hydrolase